MKNLSEVFAHWAIFSTTLRRWDNVPGAVIEGMSKDLRQLLQELKSDDLGYHTNFQEFWQMISSKEWESKKLFQQLRLDFDKRMKK